MTWEQDKRDTKPFKQGSYVTSSTEQQIRQALHHPFKGLSNSGSQEDAKLPCSVREGDDAWNTESKTPFVVVVPAQPFNPANFLVHAVANIICSVIFGDRFDYEDEKFITLIDLMDENNELQSTVQAQVCTFLCK